MICILSLPLFAASNGSPNAIRVNWLKKYNPDKLSVISFHNFIYMEDITCDKEEIIPASLDYIIAINGKKTDSIATEDIYPILNGRDGRVELLMHSIAHDVDYELGYAPINLNMEGFDETFENLDGLFIFNQATIDAFKNSGVEIRADRDVPDWGKYRTISIVLSSSDPLLEKEFAPKALDHLTNSGFPLTIDNENPDLILKVSFNEEESVTSTYVPQTNTYIDQGSNTYVTQGKYGIYVNSFKRAPKRITEGGYTHEDVSNTHFLEITILDAKKMLDPAQNVPPILWQLRYSKRLDYSQSLRSVSDNVLKYCRTFPGTSTVIQPCRAWSGICWDENRPIVTDVYKHSPAEKLGLQPGDEILKINGKSKIGIRNRMWLNGKLVWDKTSMSVRFKKYCLGKLLTEKTDVFPHAFQESPTYQKVENNPYIDYSEISFPDFIHKANKNDSFEIKRNGKKMTLTGKLYEATWFFPVNLTALDE